MAKPLDKETGAAAEDGAGAGAGTGTGTDVFADKSKIFHCESATNFCITQKAEREKDWKRGGERRREHTEITTKDFQANYN